MAKGYLKAAFESLPGNETNTPTLSTKVIYFPLVDGSPDVNANPMERDDELRNLDEPVAVIPEAFAPSQSFDSRAYPDVIGFLFKGVLGAPTTTAGNGVITDPDAATIPTGATKHVWTAPFGPSGVTPQTMELIWAYSDQSVFLKQKGVALEQLQIDTQTSGGVHFKPSGPALYQTRIADPSLSPTYESLAIRPFTYRDLNLTWLGSSAVATDFNVTIDNPVDAVNTMGSGSMYPDVMEKGDGILKFSGSVNKRDLTATDYDALVNSTGFSATARFGSTTVIGATSYTYKFWIAMSNCQYVGGSVDSLNNSRHRGANFNFAATSASAGTPSVTVTLVNATASYA
jgi:hypothetical protein